MQDVPPPSRQRAQLLLHQSSVAASSITLTSFRFGMFGTAAADLSSEAWLVGPGCAANAMSILAGPPRQAFVCSSSGGPPLNGSSSAISRGLVESGEVGVSVAVATGGDGQQGLSDPVAFSAAQHYTQQVLAEQPHTPSSKAAPMTSRDPAQTQQGTAWATTSEYVCACWMRITTTPTAHCPLTCRCLPHPAAEAAACGSTPRWSSSTHACGPGSVASAGGSGQQRQWQQQQQQQGQPYTGTDQAAACCLCC